MQSLWVFSVPEGFSPHFKISGGNKEKILYAIIVTIFLVPSPKIS